MEDLKIYLDKDCPRITEETHLKELLDGLLDYTQIEEGLAVFKRLCRYCFSFYPQMTAEYIYIYRDLYDPDYAKDYDDEESDEVE